ncbi:MAG: hypothetical protein AAFP04_12100 [Myxococcota bacterium]
MVETQGTPSHWSSDISRRAVQRLKDALLGGGLESLIAIEPATGEILNADARALFSSLPAVTPATAPDELVEQGLLERVPKNLRSALEQPRYRAGREVFVRASVNHRSDDPDQPAGRYDPLEPPVVTHLGRLVARSDSSFHVEVEDAPLPLSFSREDVFAWNEPSGYPPQGGVLSGVEVDYNDPLLKAHICAAMLDLSPGLAELDLEDGDDAQKTLVHRAAAKIRIEFAGRGQGYRGARAGALLSNGEGISFVQRAVAVGFLQAFSRVLAFDIQAAVGRTLDRDLPHGFAVITLRPSMRRYVCDPSWREPLTDARVAFFGPGWGHNRRVLSFEGWQQVTVRPEEIELPTIDEESVS